MSTANELPNLVLTRRLADGTIEWIPLNVPQHVAADPGAAYSLIDRADYDAPDALVARRAGDNLIVEVGEREVLVLDGFFVAPAVAFYPTPDVAGGAGPFSGAPITAESLVLAGSPDGSGIVWSAEPVEAEVAAAAVTASAAGSGTAGGGASPLVWGGLAAGGLGLLAVAGGGGGSGGGSGGGGAPPDTTPPQITSGTTASAINENSGAGQVVYTAAATDTSQITWSLAATGDAAAFSINASSGAVTLTGNPDFEAKPSYTFTVVATDAANNRTQQTVSLAIVDQDDSAPTITSSATATPVNENTGAGQVVYTATGTDTSPITWSLAATGDAAAFSINPSTGVVTLTGNPDFETKSSYTFTVVATDAGNNAAQQTVTLAIVDQDDSAPNITSGATAAPVNENVAPGRVVYTGTATDQGAVTWSLKSGDDAAAFRIDARTGVVTLLASPNFEAKSSYRFTVIATDGDDNRSEQAVNLTVNNLDEVAPTITSPATATAIDENSGANQAVYTVTSTDTGDISASPTTYSLSAAGDGSAFTIDATTGVVRLTANPNQETKPSYTFTVVATDAAGNASQRAVTLAINDLDEVAPTITSPATAPAINENSGANQAVYTVTSTDTGDISTGATTYSLSAAGDGSAFTIDPATGVVRLTANPNFETKSSYSFTVVATDAAGNASQRAVTLAINNLDEVAPTITSPATATAIVENSGANQAVYTVTSTDTGDISTGATTYSLSAAGDGGAFTINGTTGVVRLTANPDFETKSSYTFTVVATDAAGNSSQLPVSLAITDIPDESAPTVASVAVSGAIGAQNNTLNAGDTVQVTVTMSENTIVSTAGGTPRIALNIGASTVFANYASGSGTSSLVFTYVVQASNTDANGISIAANALQANGGTLRDATGNTAVLTHAAVPDNAAFLVDTTAPTVASVALTGAIGAQNSTLNAGDTVQVTVTMSEATTVSTAGGTPRIALTVGASTVFANYASGSGTSSLVFTYVVQAGDTDANGISIAANALQANGGSLTDAAGNAATLAHAGIANNASFLVDTTAPALTSSVPADGATAVAVGANIVLTFNDQIQAGSGNITISNGTDTRVVAVTDATQVTFSGSQVTINLASDLLGNSNYNVQIANGALTDEAGNPYPGISNPTTLNFATQVVADTTVVVFDLVQGSSSSHSGRTFQAGVSYDIYIRVDSNSDNLSTAGGGPGTWGTWSGTANLGADDRIILVGDGSAVEGDVGFVTGMVVNAGEILWQSAAVGVDAARLAGATFTRVTGPAPGGVDTAVLFSAAPPAAFFAGQEGQLNTMYLTNMPAGILTSQGLL
jgi:methionine-rich copper-binding protein CopC/uncharacterized OB-fold protein